MIFLHKKKMSLICWRAINNKQNNNNISYNSENFVHPGNFRWLKQSPKHLRVTANILRSTLCTLDWWFGGLPYNWEERREKWREAREKGDGSMLCFRSVLKDYPFISAHILVSVVTQREASTALSGRDLQRVMRRPSV